MGRLRPVSSHVDEGAEHSRSHKSKNRPRKGVSNARAASRNIQMYRGELNKVDGLFTFHDVDISAQQLKIMYRNGVLNRYPPDPESESNAHQYEITEMSQEYLDELNTNSPETICPCNCLQDGVKNLGDGVYQCPHCEKTFEREELNT